MIVENGQASHTSSPDAKAAIVDIRANGLLIDYLSGRGLMDRVHSHDRSVR
jgi:hypothetical protein